MKCLLNGIGVLYPCSSNCLVYGDCVAAFDAERKPKPQTNADRIRAMSDEELADKFTVLAYGPHGMWFEPDGRTYHSMSEDARKAWLDWLKQPVKDGEGDG